MRLAESGEFEDFPKAAHGLFKGFFLKKLIKIIYNLQKSHNCLYIINYEAQTVNTAMYPDPMQRAKIIKYLNFL